MALKPVQLHETKALTTNTTTTIQIPVGGKIHDFGLRFATGAGADVTEAAIRAEIGNITLTINGKQVIFATAAVLLDFYEVLGQNVDDPTGVASVLELNVGRLMYTDPAVRDLFGLGTNNIQSIQVQVTAGTLATIANVQAFTSREAKNEDLGMYIRLINYPVSFNSTGVHTVDTLPRDPDSSYLFTMASPGASGTLTFGEVKVNNVSIKDITPKAVNDLFLSNNRYNVPSGYYIYGFADGNLDTRLPMVGVNDLRFNQTFSVAPGAAGYSMTVISAVNLETMLAKVRA